MSTEYLLAAAGVIVSILGYLLAKKDDAQEKKITDLAESHGKQISALWEKHDSDARALQNLELLVASKHYERGELDFKFDKLESSFKEGMVSLGAKVDRLTEAVIHKGGGV